MIWRLIRVRTDLGKPGKMVVFQETQGNSGKVLKNHANSGKTQRIFSALYQQKHFCITFEVVLMELLSKSMRKVTYFPELRLIYTIGVIGFEVFKNMENQSEHSISYSSRNFSAFLCRGNKS